MGTIARGKVQRGDLANWDGKTATATRVDATGGTITGLAIGNEVDILAVYGASANRTVGTIAAAAQGVTGSATLVFAPGTWTIDDDVTIPANLTCHIPDGCLFSVDSGKTLTINGHVQAGICQIFSGAGTVAGLGKNSYVTPHWWQENTTPGTTDMTVAIQAANDVVKTAGGGSVDMLGTYAISAPIILSSGVKLRGANTQFDSRSNDTPTTKILMTVNDTNAVTIDQADLVSGYHWGAGIEDIAIYGTGAGTTGAGLYLDNPAFFHTKNVFITGFYHGISLDFGAYMEWANVYCKSNIYADLYYRGTKVTTSQIFNHCTFRQSPHCVVIKNSNGNGQLVTTFDSCLFESPTEDAFILDYGASVKLNDPYFENCPDLSVSTTGTIFDLGAAGSGPTSISMLEIHGGTINGTNGGGYTESSIFRISGTWQTVKVNGGQYGRATSLVDGTTGGVMFDLAPTTLIGFTSDRNHIYTVGYDKDFATGQQFDLSNTEHQNNLYRKKRSPVKLALSGDVIVIPVTSQNNNNRHNLVRVMGVDGTTNSQTTRGFYTTFEFGNLTTLGSLTTHEAVGGITSVAISGMSLLLTVPTALTAPVINVELLSMDAQNIELDNIYVTQQWAATTAYSVGDIRLNDTNKLYIVTIAGTSAGGGGPTGTGTDIADNTVVWDYHSA